MSTEKTIIDISQYQNKVDYAALAKSVDGCIIRIGYRGWGDTGTLQQDSMFKKHVEGMIANKIPFGFYFFSQATNKAEGEEEATYAYNLIKSYSPTYPIYIDSELSGAASNSGRADKITKTNRTAAVVGFCEKIKSYGLTPGVYASESWFESNLTFSKIKSYSIWCAKYGSNTGKPGTKPTTATYDGWQYTSKGVVDGIDGGVDLSIFYKEFGKTTSTSSSTKTTTTTFKAGQNVKLLVNLKVRTGAGTNYKQKTRAQLTTDGRKKALNQTMAVLKKGSIVTLQKVTKKSSKEYWAKIPSGWICIIYNGEKYVSAT